MPSVFAALSLALFAGARSNAQENRPFQPGGRRAIVGVVVDESQRPIANAVVPRRVAPAGTKAASAIEVYVSVDNLLCAVYRDFLDTTEGLALGPGGMSRYRRRRLSCSGDSGR